jgi:endonuclease/exonuclease/phosphatase family metal-dependent hydrolase
LIMDEYAYTTPVPSHSGFVTTLIHRSTVADTEVKLDSQFTLPGASGALLQLGDRPLMLFSMHLTPYKDSAPLRQKYLSELITQLPPGPLILAGDMNMREAETSFVVDSLELSDVYLDIDPGKEHYATWDSTLNLYHKEGFTFRARFDRVFSREIKPQAFNLIGTEVQSNENHFLSDHFGIHTEFAW